MGWHVWTGGTSACFTGLGAGAAAARAPGAGGARVFCVPNVWLLGPEKTGTTSLFHKARAAARGERRGAAARAFRNVPALASAR